MAGYDDEVQALVAHQRRLYEQVLEVIEAGASLVSYQEASQKAFAHASSLPGTHGIAWLSKIQVSVRNSQHLCAALQYGNEGIAEHLFPLWAPDRNDVKPILSAITHNRRTWLSRLLGVRKSLKKKDISSLYQSAVASAEGATLTALMECLPIQPDALALWSALTQQSAHRADVLDVLLQARVGTRTPGGDSLVTIALRENQWEAAHRLWEQEPLTATPEDQEDLWEAWQIILWEGDRAWGNRLRPLLPSGNPEGRGWETLAESARNTPAPDLLAWQADQIGPVALRKAWVLLLDKEEWAALDPLVTVVPRTWSAILMDMPEVAAHLPQTRATFRAEALDHRIPAHTSERRRRS